jgi:dsDNA-binding SOS-regulon protein
MDKSLYSTSETKIIENDKNEIVIFVKKNKKVKVRLLKEPKPEKPKKAEVKKVPEKK